MENLDEAILKFLDGEMTSTEEQKLAQAIKDDPQGKEKLAFLMSVNSAIPSVLADKKAGELPSKSKKVNKLLPFLILAAAACIYFTFFFRSNSIAPEEMASVINMHGIVWVEEGGVKSKLKKSMLINSGTKVEVESGSLSLDLGNGRANIILHNKTVALLENNQGIEVHLQNGLISADVKPMKPKGELRFTTSHTEALVLGTKLRVYRKAGLSELEVLSGSVKYKCTNSNKSITVKDKQFALASDKDLVPELKNFPDGATGFILWEKWKVSKKIYEIPKFRNNYVSKQKADLKSVLPSFESPSEIDDYYGSVTSGLLHVPESGEYTFWIAADVKAKLYLSTDQSMTKARVIASVDKWNHSRAWDDSVKQKSKAFQLEKGKSYFIRVVHIEDDQNDSMSVAWEGPGFNREIIPGRYLSPGN